MTETADPSLEKLRKAIDAPIFAKSTTDSENKEPNRAIPKSDSDDPNRLQLRSDNDEPR